MDRAARLILFALLALPACRTARDVAESSARVATAPARLVGRTIRGADPNDVTTQVYEAPVVQPPPLGPAPPPPVRTAPLPRPRETASTPQNAAIASPAPTRTQERIAAAPPTPSPTSRPAVSQPSFPVAKPVPGKPGYVFSPYDPNGGYVDVTGYQSGSKVKDPYSQKIFLVP